MMASGLDLKRAILTTRWLPDHPGIFRQAGITFALEKENVETNAWMVYSVTKSLWSTGFLERTLVQTSYPHAGGILRTHWYTFAAVTRESDKPGWRRGEQKYAQLWKLTGGRSTPRIAVPEIRERSVPTSRQVKGLPNPDDLEWVTWEGAPQLSKTYLQLYMSLEMHEAVADIATVSQTTRQEYIRGLIEQDLKRRHL